MPAFSAFAAFPTARPYFLGPFGDGGQDPASFAFLTGEYSHLDPAIVNPGDGVSEWPKLSGSTGHKFVQTVGTQRAAETADGILADNDDLLVRESGGTLGDLVDADAFTLLFTGTTPTVVDTDVAGSLDNDSWFGVSNDFGLYFRSSEVVGIDYRNVAVTHENVETAVGLGTKVVIVARLKDGVLGIRVTDGAFATSPGAGNIRGGALVAATKLLADGRNTLSAKGPLAYFHFFNFGHSDSDIDEMVEFQIARI